MNLCRLSRDEVTVLLLVDARTITAWLKEAPPLPSHTTGKKVAGKDVAYFVWSEVMEWRDARKHRELFQKAVARNEDVPNEKVERALLTRAKREAQEIETARKRREALAVSDFEQAMADMIAPARANLLAIEARLRPDLGAEAAAKVGAQIRLALRSLAETGDKE